MVMTFRGVSRRAEMRSARSRLHRPDPDGRLEAALRTALIFLGNPEFFLGECALRSATRPVRNAASQTGPGRSSPFRRISRSILWMTRQSGGGSNVQFVFADHTLDTERRELRRGTEAIAVEPQVLDLLIYAGAEPRSRRPKDDLIASVWGGRIVSDATLTSRIYAARKAVGDDGHGQKLIRTIARKGLRFVGDVHTQGRMAMQQHRRARRRRKKRGARRTGLRRIPSGPPSPCCRSTICAAIRRRNTFRTASAKISSPRYPNCAGSS